MALPKATRIKGALPEFHPLTLLRDWGGGEGYRISDALTGTVVFGATGSGKSSGPGKHIAYGFLANGFGGIVMCSKSEEADIWRKWAEETGRIDDLVVIDKEGEWRFNPMDYEGTRSGRGAGIAINLVAMMSEIAGAVRGSAGGGDHGGSDKFWEESLAHMLANLVTLALLAGIPVSLLLLRSILDSAPLTVEETQSEQWQKGTCSAILREADLATRQAGDDARADYEEVLSYWMIAYPNLSEKTRSIINLTFSMLVRPFVTSPLHKLFSTDTNITPEDAFTGKIIVIDIPIQEYRLTGRVAQMVWKFCFQVAVLRRIKPEDSYLRPVFLWADEAQNFVSLFDAEYQAVARSAGGCTVYLTQNIDSYKRVLGNDAAVESLLGNMQCKMFAQNMGGTNEWASRLLGERFVYVTGTNVGRGDQGNGHAGVSTNEQRRYYVEPSRFTTLKRGGELNNCEVEVIVYNGGKQFPSEDGRELLPYRLLTFKQ